MAVCVLSSRCRTISTPHRSSPAVMTNRCRSVSCFAALRKRPANALCKGPTRTEIADSQTMPGSTEVPARADEAAQQMRHVDEPLRNQMAHFPLALPDAIDREQRCAQCLFALRLEQTRPHDHIDVARLVFERHEHHALRRPGPLTHRDEPASARETPVAITPQCRRR